MNKLCHIQVIGINKIGAPCHQLNHLKHVVIKRPALPNAIKMKIELINQTLESKFKSRKTPHNISLKNIFVKKISF